MATAKRVLLVRFIAVQTILILLLGMTAIIFRNEVIKAKAEANYYYNELKASHEGFDFSFTPAALKREPI